LNILLFISALTGGGAERVTVGLANYLVRNGHQATILTLHDSSRDFYTPDERVKRLSLNLAGENRGLSKLTANWCRIQELRRMVRSEQPDVVVGMMPTATILCILACAGLATRVVGSERNYPGKKQIGRVWSLMRRLVYRFADAHVAQTKEGRDWIIRYAAAKNVSVIPNAVTWPILACNPHVQPLSLVAPERRVILAVGSKADQKGFDLLLQAYAAIANQHPDWDLVIVGLASIHDANSCAREKLEELSDSLGIAERVHFTGLVGNVGDWYERADLFVLSSRYEGFPNVLLEAMAAGCACLAFDCKTGPRDVINHEINGLLVKDGNVSAMTSAINRAVGDIELRKKMSEQASKVVEDFSEAVVFEKWDQLFREIQ